MKNSFFLCLILPISLFGQESIILKNSTFDGFPRPGVTPKGWQDCGGKDKTPPDVLGSEFNEFEVRQKPFDGNTFLGMVVRDDGTTEKISQKLPQKLEEEMCYQISIALARSSYYLGPTKNSKGARINMATPSKLKIWGGNEICDKTELLAESSMIINTRWLVYNFDFQPTQDLEFIIFEAFYKEPSLYPYNGNILLDKISAIKKVDCNEGIPAESAEKDSNEIEETFQKDSTKIKQSNDFRIFVSEN